MATIDQTMMKVQRILTGPMNLKIQLQGELIGVVFTDSTTVVSLRMLDFGKTKDGEPRTVVRVFAPILRGVPPTPALYEYLARETPRTWFGSIVVDEDKMTPGTVILTFGHSLLGDYLDEQELSVTLYHVHAFANSIDDQLQQRFGGKRLADK